MIAHILATAFVVLFLVGLDYLTLYQADRCSQYAALGSNTHYKLFAFWYLFGISQFLCYVACVTTIVWEHL